MPEQESHGHDIIVVGASAGGVEALSALAAQLPRDLPAAVFVVLHISPGGVSVLPRILSRAGRVPACHAEDGMEPRPGRIYVAPPDRHLTLQPGVIRVLRGPHENRHRPAVDP
ncbi:MAG TPA: chemotaxis protein CheB, partial [Armatimonadota bacterium]|nr:chemotaxis protein CheB [Armatimonadota bacterium]